MGSPSTKALPWLLAVAALAWLAALTAAPYLAGIQWDELNVLGAGVYLAAAVVCHQQPDRSFHLWSAQLPVCARCAGIYAGAAVAAVVVAARASRPRASGRVPSARTARRLLAWALLPSVLTLLYEWSTGDVPSNWVRASAGLPLGAVAAALIGTLR
jgi:hypothetical protein